MRTAALERMWLVAGALVVFAAVGAAPVAAQVSHDVDIATDYPTVAIEPGEQATLDVRVSSTPAAPVQLDVTGVPEGWDTSLRGGGFVVGEVFAEPEKPPRVTLEATAPSDVQPGAYTMRVTATAANGVSDSLELEFRVQERVSGQPTLSAEFPTLEGAADTTFTYDVTLDNPTPREQTFRLAATGPQGWSVSVNPTGNPNAATVSVGAGQSGQLNVEADPPPGASAGSYPITVRATGAEQPAELELTATITGTRKLTLAAANQRLSFDVHAGETSEKTMVVRNEGSAPLRNVQLQTTPPSGWDASFSPGRIQAIPAGESVKVTLAVTPSEDAVNGDYMTTVSANAAQAQDQAEVRTSVQTSGLWGLIGAGGVVLALGGLGWVFRVFGRR